MLSALLELFGAFLGLFVRFAFLAVAAVVIHAAVSGYLDSAFGIEVPTTFINEGFESFIELLLETMNEIRDEVDDIKDKFD